MTQYQPKFIPKSLNFIAIYLSNRNTPTRALDTFLGRFTVAPSYGTRDPSNIFH